MTKILIIGGHGKIALLAEPMLVQAGHEVDAAIRNPEQQPAVEATGARAVIADIEQMDQAAVTELVSTYDVVVWSAGAGGGDPARTKAVDEDAALRVLEAVDAAGSRLLMVSYFGAAIEHGIPADSSFFAYAEAKGRVDDAIRRSRCDWMILAPSTLTLDPEGGIEANSSTSAEAARGVTPGSIPRATVARLITEVVNRPDLAGHTIRCNGGDIPVAHYLDDLA